jgi:ribulose-phosphate 3-epimerase
MKLTDLPASGLLAEFSLWSADLTRLADEIQRTEPWADLYHLDVSDGHFTSRLLFFPDLVARVRAITTKPLHVHLMADASILLGQITQFAESGADLISIHVMPDPLVGQALDRIQQEGNIAGLVLNPGDEPESVGRFLDRIAWVTLLGTQPGVKGKRLLPEALPRVRRMRALLQSASSQTRIRIAADGGIRRETVPLLREAGADTVVMGSLAFSNADLPGTIEWLHGLPVPSWTG